MAEAYGPSQVATGGDVKLFRDEARDQVAGELGRGWLVAENGGISFLLRTQLMP